MNNNELLVTASRSSQNHMWLERGWHKDAKYWLNHWRIEEEVTLQNINNIKTTITSKFKEKLWFDKDI